MMKLGATLILAFLIVGCSTEEKREITASGTIETTEVTVSAKVGGEIMQLLVDEGAEVGKHDTLALIDRTDLVIQLKQAEANAAALEAQYKLTLKGFRAEDILQAEATFRNAQEDLKRADELYKAHSIARKQFDDAQTRFVVAQQAYEKMKRGSRVEEIEAARAKRDLAVAQVEGARKKLSDANVVAPMQGVVTQKAVEAGDMVMPNGSLFRISRLDRVHLMIYVSEVELASIKLGQEAQVYIDAYRDKPLLGTIIYISDKAEFTPKNVQTKDDRTRLVFGVKIEVPNPEQLLKPGMPADATIDIRTRTP
ncbi:MAG: efflux RND transporter periplasmic adaptor subunit [Bacteroidota bacterium]